MVVQSPSYPHQKHGAISVLFTPKAGVNKHFLFLIYDLRFSPPQSKTLFTSEFIRLVRVLSIQENPYPNIILGFLLSSTFAFRQRNICIQCHTHFPIILLYKWMWWAHAMDHSNILLVDPFAWLPCSRLLCVYPLMVSIEFLPFDFGPEIPDHRHTRQLNIKPPGWGSVLIKIKKTQQCGFCQLFNSLRE